MTRTSAPSGIQVTVQCYVILTRRGNLPKYQEQNMSICVVLLCTKVVLIAPSLVSILRIPRHGSQKWISRLPHRYLCCQRTLISSTSWDPRINILPVTQISVRQRDTHPYHFMEARDEYTACHTNIYLYGTNWQPSTSHHKLHSHAQRKINAKKLRRIMFKTQR
jgi:hypothetical protein